MPHPRHRHRARALALTAVLAAGVLGAACSASSPPSAAAGGAGAVAAIDVVEANTSVTRIVDGDTIVVALKDAGGKDEHVRLIGIDTPETKKPNSPVECFGQEATDHLRTLLPDGTRIRLERDAEERDRYGRLLAYVYRASDGLFINLAMADDGYAAQLTVPPNVAHAETFRTAAETARQQNRGLWSACASPHTPVAGSG